MERAVKSLWAPWRMDYIRSDKEEGCFICRILSEDNDRANLLIRRGRHCNVLMNRYPYNNGHLMIAPNRHVSALKDLQPDEKLELIEYTDWCVEILKRVCHPEGFNAGLNLGRVAGAGLESHLHMHVVPRWNGDTNFMPVLGETKVIPQHLDDLYEQLMHAAGQPE